MLGFFSALQLRNMQFEMEENSNISPRIATLPPAIIACLQLADCEEEDVLAEINDATEVEADLRENWKAYKDAYPDKFNIGYGIFNSSPENFRFTLGQRTKLQRVITLLKGGKQPTVKQNGHKAIQKRRSKASLSSSPEFKPKGSSNPPLPNELIPVIYNQISRRISKWSLQQRGELGQLKEDTHYSLNITPTISTIKCLICEKSYQISRAKGMLVISNYTRHLERHCKFGKGKKSPPKKQRAFPNNESSQPDDDKDTEDGCIDIPQCTVEMAEENSSNPTHQIVPNEQNNLPVFTEGGLANIVLTILPDSCDGPSSPTTKTTIETNPKAKRRRVQLKKADDDHNG